MASVIALQGGRAGVASVIALQGGRAGVASVIALQGGHAHLGSHMAYSAFAEDFVHTVTYIYCAIISRFKCVACAQLLVSVVLLLL